MSDTIKSWRHIQQRYNLIGSKCTTCGDVFFPSRVICPNCRRKGNIEPFQFSGKGENGLERSAKIFPLTLPRSSGRVCSRRPPCG